MRHLRSDDRPDDDACTHAHLTHRSSTGHSADTEYLRQKFPPQLEHTIATSSVPVQPRTEHGCDGPVYSRGQPFRMCSSTYNRETHERCQRRKSRQVGVKGSGGKRRTTRFGSWPRSTGMGWRQSGHSGTVTCRECVSHNSPPLRQRGAKNSDQALVRRPFAPTQAPLDTDGPHRFDAPSRKFHGNRNIQRAKNLLHRESTTPAPPSTTRWRFNSTSTRLLAAELLSRLPRAFISHSTNPQTETHPAACIRLLHSACQAQATPSRGRVPCRSAVVRPGQSIRQIDKHSELDDSFTVMMPRGA
jgi:hypothetical protein